MDDVNSMRELTDEELAGIVGGWGWLGGRRKPKPPWGEGGYGTKGRGKQTGRDLQGRPTYETPPPRPINLPSFGSLGSIRGRF